MKKIHQKLFVAFVIGLLLLPLGYIFGKKERTRLAGVDLQTDLPSLQKTKFKTKQFQLQFEKWWQSHFLYRKAALKLKNQLYDWANFGRFHAGYNKTIAQGYNERIFETFNIRPGCRYPDDNFFKKIKIINKTMKENGHNFIFFFAPNPAKVYAEDIPMLYRFFLNDKCDVRNFIKIRFDDLGVWYFDGTEFFKEIKKTSPYYLFPKTGTHWAPYGMVVTMQAILEKFKLGKLEIEHVAKKAKPDEGERDIADLLNTLKSYRVKNETYYKVQTKAVKKMTGKVSVIGDSFSHGFWHLVRSGTVDRMNFLQIENADISRKTALSLLNSDTLIVSMIENNLSNFEFFPHKQINSLYEAIQTRNVYNFGDREEKRWTLSGISFFENETARWSEGDKTVISIPIENIKNYKISFLGMWALVTETYPIQSADVYVNGKKAATWTFEWSKTSPETVLNVSKEELKNKRIEIKFIYKNAISPHNLGINDDIRRLAFGFRDIVLE